MPNIEIHGLDTMPACEVRRKIFDMFSGKPYVRETVVTVCPTDVKDLYGNNQPFLRLVNDCQTHTQEIILALLSLRMDIEHLQLVKFYSKDG